MNQLTRQLNVLGLELAPLTPTIGAEVHGVDLARPLDAQTQAALRQALLDWKVIFFRDQDITTEQHLAFARAFGELEAHPFAPHKPGYPEVLAITHDDKSRGRENTWHSDVTWRLEPSLGSVLRAVEVPPVGGDTLFADMYAAYEGLSDEIKAEIDGRTAVHDFTHFRRGLRKKGASEAEIEAFDKAYPRPEHPVVRTHPETGRKALYVNAAFTLSIVGLDQDRSDELLRHLYAQAAIPEYQCRFRWEPNSIAFWDNRASQHYAASDYFPAVRRMERVTIVGDRPV
ncbi:TauD/TfdA dioxygenase family protein [Phenylobacterium montanum]|uniref:TauD/TfdA family dioxygenase n=1 Tax=Phenylobacterium montanum TaxID=2823693 RepID=A0A975IUD3_9CAUL|nr:TauD/TfdA family dioxygenase [Caulobacter sp. S6]QUD87404.1 TauD/TfdA family dioxygenase [Caulobacter sp. S6]